MRAIPVLLLLLLSFHGFSQKITISGTITDAGNGEVLIGAHVYVTALDRGVSTNNYGFYSITLPSVDSTALVFSYLGYQSQVKKILPEEDISLNIKMAPTFNLLGEVTVSAEQGANINRPQMGVLDIPVQKIKELPALWGEADVLKIVQLLPGVQSGNEGTTGFFVRGGYADQNLVQLDEATVYNPNHLFGLFSTFNTRAINKVTLIKGGFPAQYGGRLSSILDISMKEGNNQKLGVNGGIGLITSQLTVEGPLKKGESSFILSGRRTYFDYLVRPFLPRSVRTNYAFYDLNAKMNWKLGEKDRIFLSAFKGKDDATYSKDGIEYNILFGNSTATFRWNHLFGKKLFLNTSILYNQYEQDITALQDNAFSRVTSGINDLNGKLEFQYFPGINHAIRFGAHYVDHTFRSKGNSGAQSNTDGMSKPGPKQIPAKYFDEFALYVNDEISLSPKFTTSIGLRFPGFFNRQISYYKLEPRFSVKMALHPTASLKAAYTEMNQFIHQVPSSTAAIPTEIWVPSSINTKPQHSKQYSLGYFKDFRQNLIESSLEIYYKQMDNQVLFKEGNQLIETLDVDELLVYGQGWSYGAEFHIKKTRGKFSGWLSYTLSWTRQKFNDLNFGNVFPFKYDRRHNLSLVGTYQLTDHWTLSGVFVYSSGNVYTLPVGRFNVAHGGTLFEGNYFIYEQRNNARLNPYHRLDISASWQKKSQLFGKEYLAEWVFGIYNIYSRRNPYFVYFRVDPLTNQPKATQVSLLPIIPSISYNFKF